MIHDSAYPELNAGLVIGSSASMAGRWYYRAPTVKEFSLA